MAHVVIVEDAAVDEMIEAEWRYEQREIGLGDRLHRAFLAAHDTAIDLPLRTIVIRGQDARWVSEYVQDVSLGDVVVRPRPRLRVTGESPARARAAVGMVRFAMSRLLPKDVRALLQSYRRLLVAQFGERLVEVRLFGSRARGDASPDSDVDVAVVVRGLTDDERAAAIDLAMSAWREVGRQGPLLSPLVWDDDERRAGLAAGRRLALDVVREGIAV